MGCNVVATARSEKKCEALSALGADLVVDTSRQEFLSRIEAKFGKESVDLVLDSVGGPLFAPNIRSLRRGGRIVLIASMAGPGAEIDLRAILSKRLRIIGSTLRSRPLAEKIALTQAFVRDVLPAFSDSSLAPVIDCAYPLRNAAEAHRRMPSNENVGKIVLLVACSVPAVPAPPRAVVFDLDGTLLDSYAAIHECLARLVAFERARDAGRDDGWWATARGASRGRRPENVAGVKIFRDRYEVIGPESSTLLPGADAVTRRLVEAGIPLAIASNKPARFSREILQCLGILSRFAFVAGPDDGFPPKPAPHMVFMALSTMGAKGLESVYVGDMPVDVATARAAGIPVVVVPSGSSTEEELRAVSPDLLIRDLNELPGVLLS